MKRKKGLLLRWILLTVLMMAVMIAGAMAEEEEELMFIEQPEIIDLPMEMDDDTPLIHLSFDGYEMTFKDLLPETIIYAEAEDSLAPDMAFMLELSAEETPEEPAEETEKSIVPLFTMRMDAENGDHVILLEGQDGSIVPVSFFMETMPEGLTKKHQYEFIAAQTDVHVLTATLALTAVPEAAQKPEAAQGVFAGADYELAYVLSGEVGVAAREEENGFVFYAQIGGKDVTVFTLQIGAEEGDIVQVLPAPDGKSVYVAITMADCPQEFGDQEMDAYYTAQAAVSELMATMTLR